MSGIRRAVLAVSLAAAMMLVPAAASPAAVFLSEAESSTWQGVRSGNAHVLSLSGGQFQCNNVTFTGPVVGKERPELTVSPGLSNCTSTWTGGGTVAFAVNGCQYRFSPGEGEQLVGSVDIVNCSSAMTFSMAGCTITIGNQEDIGIVRYINVIEGGKAKVRAIAELEKITFTQQGSNCPTSESLHHNGKYYGEWLVNGSSSGSPINIKVEPTSLLTPIAFHTEYAPAVITSSLAEEEGPDQFLTFAGHIIKCPGSAFSAESKETLAEGLNVSAWFGTACRNIKVANTNVKEAVHMNGCSFAWNADGTFDIVGEQCASNPIKIAIFGKYCVITIGPQEGLSGVTFTNAGVGRTRYVKASIALTGITYTAEGEICLETGVLKNGSYSGNTMLWAGGASGQQGMWVE